MLLSLSAPRGRGWSRGLGMDFVQKGTKYEDEDPARMFPMAAEGENERAGRGAEIRK